MQAAARPRARDRARCSSRSLPPGSTSSTSTGGRASTPSPRRSCSAGVRRPGRRVGDGVTDFAVGDVVATARRSAHPRDCLWCSTQPRRAGAGRGRGGHRRRGDAAGHDRALPGQLHLSGTCGRARSWSTRPPAASGSCSCRWPRQGRARDRDRRQRREGAVAEAARRRRVIRYDEVGTTSPRPCGPPAAAACTSSTTEWAGRRSRRRSAALRPRGLLVLFGAASGPVPPFDPQRLNWRLAVPDPPDTGALHRDP